MRLAWIGVAGSFAALASFAACQGDRDKPSWTAPSTGGSSAATTSGSGAGGDDGENRIIDPDAPCEDLITKTGELDPVIVAGAAGICKKSTGSSDWGLVSAAWVRADGGAPLDTSDFHLGHGAMGGLGGISATEGIRTVGLSSGTARPPQHPEYSSGFGKNYTGNPPDGYPKEAPACPGVTTGEVHDDIGMELVMIAPDEAKSLAFDVNFFTQEWPDWVCTQFNDYFVALMWPTPEGLIDPNISFDVDGNVMSVNNALLQICGCDDGPPCAAGPLMFDCPEGNAGLGNTGFEEHAATGWLVTKAPVTGGDTVKLRWAVWDSGDGALDTTAIIDDFRWLGADEDTPITEPIEPPK